MTPVSIPSRSGSHGNVELGVNCGRGERAFGLGIGDRMELAFE
jgi:S-adenosylmethionine hydrolase